MSVFPVIVIGEWSLPTKLLLYFSLSNPAGSCFLGTLESRLQIWKKVIFFFLFKWTGPQSEGNHYIIIISRIKSDAPRMSVTSQVWWLWKEQENYQWVTDLRDQCRSLTREARNSRGLCIASYSPEQYKCSFNEVSTLVSTRVFYWFIYFKCPLNQVFQHFSCWPIIDRKTFYYFETSRNI